MGKILFKLGLMLLFLGGLWYGLSQIDFIGEFKLEELSQEQKERLSELVWDVFVEEHLVVKNDTIQGHLDSLKNKIAASGGFNADSMEVFLVRDPMVNAFALPGGQIIVMTGLIEFCEDPDEFAGVLAHEMAHIHHGHVVKKLLKEVGLTILVSIGSGQGGGIIREILKYLSSSAFDRQQESEADDSAVAWLDKAGIDPTKMATFFLRISREKQGGQQVPAWISTHPDPKERAEAIFSIAKEYDGSYSPSLDEEAWALIQGAGN